MNKQETFVVHIIDQENSTWQGQVTWLGEKETRPFRSLLELIKLMDTVVHVEEPGPVLVGEESYVPLTVPSD